MTQEIPPFRIGGGWPEPKAVAPTVNRKVLTTLPRSRELWLSGRWWPLSGVARTVRRLTYR